PPGRVANLFLEPRLDIEMDIFERAAEGECAIGDFAFDRIETLDDRLAVKLRDDLLYGEHAGMGAACGNILHRQPFVEIDGGRYDLHDCCGAAGEAAAPHFVRN